MKEKYFVWSMLVILVVSLTSSSAFAAQDPESSDAIVAGIKAHAESQADSPIRLTVQWGLQGVVLPRGVWLPGATSFGFVMAKPVSQRLSLILTADRPGGPIIRSNLFDTGSFSMLTFGTRAHLGRRTWFDGVLGISFAQEDSMIWLIPFPIAGIGVGRELLQREHYVLEGSVAYRMGNTWPYSDEGFWSSRFSIITMGLGIRYALPERVGELGNSESGDRANNLIVGGRAAAGLILLCNECVQFPAGYRTVSFYIGKERREDRLIMIDSWFTRSWRYYYEDIYTYLDWESHGIVTVAAQRNVGRLLWLRGGIGGTFGMSNWSSMARRVGPVITAGAGVNVVTVGATTIDVQMQVAAGAYPYFTRGFSVSSRVMAALGIGVSWRSFGD